MGVARLVPLTGSKAVTTTVGWAGEREWQLETLQKTTLYVSNFTLWDRKYHTGELVILRVELVILHR